MAMPIIVRKSQAACALLLIALAGCGQQHPEPAPVSAPSSTPPVSTPATTPAVPDRQPHTLVLNATGTASVTSIKYTLDGRVVRQGAVKLPWRTSLNVPTDGAAHSWTLDVEFTGRGHNDKVDLVAIYDGKVVGSAKGAASGSGNTRTEGGAGVGGSVKG